MYKMLQEKQFEYRVTQTFQKDVEALLAKLEPETMNIEFEMIGDSILEDIALIDMKLSKLGFINKVEANEVQEQEEQIKEIVEEANTAFSKVFDKIKNIKF